MTEVPWVGDRAEETEPGLVLSVSFVSTAREVPRTVTQSWRSAYHADVRTGVWMPSTYTYLYRLYNKLLVGRAKQAT